MREEYQQQIIEDSVTIDQNIGQAVAKLAFVSDPVDCIHDNENVAIKRLMNVCKKYGNNEEVKKGLKN